MTTYNTQLATPGQFVFQVSVKTVGPIFNAEGFITGYVAQVVTKRRKIQAVTKTRFELVNGIRKETYPHNHVGTWEKLRYETTHQLLSDAMAEQTRLAQEIKSLTTYMGSPTQHQVTVAPVEL